MIKVDIETMVREYRSKSWVGIKYKTNEDLTNWCKLAGWEVEDFVNAMAKTPIDGTVIELDDHGMTVRKVKQ